MFKDDENREEYSDKLDRILEEADSKIKEKPKYEYVNENNSNRNLQGNIRERHYVN